MPTKFTTLCTLGFQACVSARNENRAAHGGVCHIQTRRDKSGRIVARRVNTNGRHVETSETFEPTAEQLARWNTIAKSER